MIKVADICPLFFDPVKDKFSKDIDYVQKFHSSDKILVQVLADDGETVNAILHDLPAGKAENVPFASYEVNERATMYYFVLKGLEDSIYDMALTFMKGGKYETHTSERFMVSSSIDLFMDTMLMKFSHKDNNSPFDNIFWIGDEQQVINLRLEAGFKPSGISMKVSNEQFRNQFQEIIELYSIPYKTMSLDCGDASGMPYWFAEFLNKALCLSRVEMNGKGYVRSEGNVPEMSQVDEYGQVFNFSILLEPSENDISGIGGRPEEASGSSMVGFLIENPKDGEMLQYDGEKSAFRNVNNVGI